MVPFVQSELTHVPKAADVAAAGVAEQIIDRPEATHAWDTFFNGATIEPVADIYGADGSFYLTPTLPSVVIAPITNEVSVGINATKVLIASGYLGKRSAEGIGSIFTVCIAATIEYFIQASPTFDFIS
jgi:hypothetical protein